LGIRNADVVKLKGGGGHKKGVAERVICLSPP